MTSKKFTVQLLKMLFCLSAIGIFSCSSDNFIRPQNIHNFRNRNIIVYLKNGTTVNFKGGEYTVEQKLIRGISNDSTHASFTEKGMEISIPLDSIEHIELPDQTGNRIDNIFIFVSILCGAAILYFLNHPFRI